MNRKKNLKDTESKYINIVKEEICIHEKRYEDSRGICVEKSEHWVF